MRRKRSLRQRIMAAFLSAVLVAGMTLNATPITAHAAENAEVSDSTEAAVIENNVAVEEPKEASLTDNAEAESGTSVTTEGDNAESGASITTEADNAESNTSVTTETNNAESSASVTTEGENTEVQETVSGNDAPEMQPENAQPQEISMIQNQEMQTELYSVSTLAETQTYTSKDGNYQYTVNGNDATITKYNGGGTVVTIPDIIDGKTVTAIGNSAFTACKSLIEITIPNTVTSIGNDAFWQCTNLTTVTIPSSVTSIGNYAFASCSLTEVTIPEGVTSIGNDAFWQCTDLTTVTIPSSVTKIGNGAFNFCASLTTVTIPEGVTCINESTFICCTSLREVTIPEGVTSIGDSAFWNCTDLTTVTIPEGVETIGNEAFDECSSLTSVTIPSSVTSIGNSAFIGDINITYSSCKHKWAKVNKNSNKFTNVTWKTSNMTHYEGTKPTCTEEGREEYYECSVCNKWFEDAQGTKEITDKSSGVIQKKDHEYDMSKWKSDGTNHWHECTCGAKKDETTHSFGEWNVTKAATETEKGLQERNCTACGYKQTEEIPVKESQTTDTDKTDTDKTDTGKIETDKKQGENAPATDFATPKKDLIDAVLTPGEQSLVDDGTDIKIILDIDNIDASVNQTDKQAVIDKADGYEVGQYLDINLYKLIGKDKTKISKTSGKIKITIAVPDTLKNTDSKGVKSYAVVRVHDGKAEILTDLDNDEATITIETDLFSTYAIVYRETADTYVNNNSADKDNAGKKDDVPETGDEMPVEIYATLAMIAGFTYLIMLFGGRKKGMTEEKKNELTDSIISWGKKGGKIRRLIALGIIFIILCYYHSIGKDTELDLQDIMLNP